MSTTRKSTRLGTKPAIAFTALQSTIDDDAEFPYYVSDSDDDDRSGSGKGPAQKKRKKSGAAAGRGAKKNIKGRRGKLGALPYVTSPFFFEMCPRSKNQSTTKMFAGICHWIFCTRSVQKTYM
jgi:hypothetical protein